MRMDAKLQNERDASPFRRKRRTRFGSQSRAALARPSSAALSRSESSARRAKRPYHRAILNARSMCPWVNSSTRALKQLGRTLATRNLAPISTRMRACLLGARHECATAADLHVVLEQPCRRVDQLWRQLGLRRTKDKEEDRALETRLRPRVRKGRRWRRRRRRRHNRRDGRGLRHRRGLVGEKGR